jgi:hypothetical protein
VASAKAVLNTLRPQAETALAALFAQPYETLVALPAVSAIEIAGSTRPATLTTYRDLLSEGRLRVVVQLVVKGVLGSARIWAKGFFLVPAAQPVEATHEELYEFF